MPKAVTKGLSTDKLRELARTSEETSTSMSVGAQMPMSVPGCRTRDLPQACPATAPRTS